MEKTYNIKNKQTGYIFNMSKADCDFKSVTIAFTL